MLLTRGVPARGCSLHPLLWVEVMGTPNGTPRALTAMDTHGPSSFEGWIIVHWEFPQMRVPQNGWFLYNGQSYLNGWFGGDYPHLIAGPLQLKPPELLFWNNPPTRFWNGHTSKTIRRDAPCSESERSKVRRLWSRHVGNVVPRSARQGRGGADVPCGKDWTEDKYGSKVKTINASQPTEFDHVICFFAQWKLVPKITESNSNWQGDGFIYNGPEEQGWRD